LRNFSGCLILSFPESYPAQKSVPVPLSFWEFCEKWAKIATPKLFFENRREWGLEALLWTA